MTLKLVGKKKGMTQLFDKNGNAVACTLIFAEPNVVVQKKSKEVDGYNGLQMGVFSAKKKRISKPLIGHFSKVKLDPLSVLSETRVENIESYEIGQKVGVSSFNVGEFVDVSGVSKGKGYQGVIKLHGFAGGPGAHGSGFHRHAGSTGMRTTPGRCFPGAKRASHMGSDFITVQNVEIVAIDAENNLIAVKGAVPGSNGSVVYLKRANKK